MRQFGADLGFAGFSGNSLTASNENLFEFNPNLKYIFFPFNPLKYIDPVIFQHFKNMEKPEKLRSANFENCNCLHVLSFKARLFEWNINHTCNDEVAKNENFNIVDQQALRSLKQFLNKKSICWLILNKNEKLICCHSYHQTS